MMLKHLKPIDQTSEYMEKLCIKNDTTVSSCGYITCALIEYLAELERFDPQTDLAQINQHLLTPYIEKVMGALRKSRKNEIKKFWNHMNQSQRKNYFKDWVANFQVVDYLQGISQKMVNNQVYSFRQCAFDHPQGLQSVRFEQLERIKQEEQFKGERIFFTRFHPQKKNQRKQAFCDQISKSDKQKPIILATDVLGHFHVTVLFKGVIYVLDSLTDKAISYDQYIVEYISNCYKKSYLIN